MQQHNGVALSHLHIRHLAAEDPPPLLLVPEMPQRSCPLLLFLSSPIAARSTASAKKAGLRRVPLAARQKNFIPGFVTSSCRSVAQRRPMSAFGPRCAANRPLNSQEYS